RAPLLPTLFPYTTLFRSERLSRFRHWPHKGANFCDKQGNQRCRPTGRGWQEPENVRTAVHMFYRKEPVGWSWALSLHAPLDGVRSEEHTSELQSQSNLVC